MSIFDFRQDPLHMIALAYQHVENLLDTLLIQQKSENGPKPQLDLKNTFQETKLDFMPMNFN